MPVFFFSALPVSSVDLGSSTTNGLFTDPVIIYDLMVTSEQYYETIKLWQALIGFRWEQTGHRCSDFSRSGQAEKSVNEQNLLFCSLFFFCGIFPFILTYVKTKHYLELIVQGVNCLFFWRRITGTEVKTQGWRWAVMHELQTGLFAFSGWCCLVSYSNNWDFIRLLTKGKFTWAELLKKTHSTGCASERLTWPWYTFDTQHCKTRAT